MNYKFGLYIDGKLADTTNLDEDNIAHAEYLFFEEFGWEIPINRGDYNSWKVQLIEQSEDIDLVETESALESLIEDIGTFPQFKVEYDDLSTALRNFQDKAYKVFPDLRWNFGVARECPK